MESNERPRADTRRPYQAPQEALSQYLRDLQGLPLLNAAEELELAREIELLACKHWRALLSYPRAWNIVADAVESELSDAVETLASLRRLVGAPASHKARTVALSTAELLQQLDFGHVALTAADAAVREAFDSDAPARAYLARVARAKAAAQRAKDRLVAANLRLVIALARRQPNLMPLADLIQEGNLGLIRAVDRFDHRRGHRFSTYATWWIRHSFNRALSDKARIVRVPVHALDEVTRAARLRSAGLRATGVAPSTDDLAEQLGIEPEKLERLQLDAVLTEPLSFDSPLGPEHDATLYDVLPASDQPDPAEALDRSSWTEELKGLLGTLTSIEAAVLRFRFGLNGGEELTLLEVGRKYNLSRERIRQLQEQAFAKLRDKMRTTRSKRSSAAQVTGAAATVHHGPRGRSERATHGRTRRANLQAHRRPDLLRGVCVDE